MDFGIKKEERRKRKLGKRGEITSEQTVKFVLPVLAFLIVLGFLVYLSFKEAAQEDICHLSVLSRGTSPESAQALIPLKCSTKKICLTDGNGKCEDSLAGESEIEVVKLPSDNKKAARVIEEVSAEAMYSCWKMMGEGKIDIFGSYAKSRGFDVSKPTCIICSRVAVDKGVGKDVMDKIDVHRYMKENRIPDEDLTFLQSFTDRSVNSYPYVSRNLFEDTNIAAPEKSDKIEDVRVNGREIALVFMQIRSKKVSDVLTNLGGDALLVAGGAFITPPVRKVAPKILSFRTTGVLGIGVILGTASMASINAYSGQMIAAGYCGALTSTVQDKRLDDEGCSIVEAVPYDFRAINTMCEEIEGMP